MRVFISHISEEKEIALVLKRWIRRSLKGRGSTFASSSIRDVPLGVDWMNRIERALDTSDIILLLCSPVSIKRPWINFEAGYGWIKEVPIVPICHSGQRIGTLPPPFSRRNAIELEDIKFPQKLFQEIRGHLGSEKLRRMSFSDMRKELLCARGRVREKLRVIEAPSMFELWQTKEVFEALRGAPPKCTVKILQTWFPDTEDICDELENLLIHKGKRFRLKILLMHKGESDPCNDILDARIKHRAEDRQDAHRNMEDTVARLVKIKKRVDARWKNANSGELKLQIRTYDFLPFGPIYQIGRKAIFAGFYICYASSIRAPMIVTRNPKSKIWERFEENFNVGWRGSKRMKIVSP